MVDSALMWISILALAGAGGVGASLLHYIRESEPDYLNSAFGAGVVGYSIQLGMANGYLARNSLFNALMLICAGLVVVCAVLAMKRGQRGFRLLRNNSQ
jgi:ABC-type phosphate/phosphonate transport system permease subunit